MFAVFSVYTYYVVTIYLLELVSTKYLKEHSYNVCRNMVLNICVWADIIRIA